MCNKKMAELPKPMLEKYGVNICSDCRKEAEERLQEKMKGEQGSSRVLNIT